MKPTGGRVDSRNPPACVPANVSVAKRSSAMSITPSSCAIMPPVSHEGGEGEEEEEEEGRETQKNAPNKYKDKYKENQKENKEYKKADGICIHTDM
jgi:hypothetical protein